MNDNEIEATEALAAAWTVTTTDISARVAAGIGASSPASELDSLLSELRALRREIAELRGTTALLQSEIVRLRHDMVHRTLTRISPYAPTEGLVRLS